MVVENFCLKYILDTLKIKRRNIFYNSSSFYLLMRLNHGIKAKKMRQFEGEKYAYQRISCTQVNMLFTLGIVFANPKVYYYF